MPPYYPGSHKRHQGFETHYGDRLEKIKGPGFGSCETKFGPHIPWSLVHTTVDPNDMSASASEYAFRNEAFCPLLCVCSLKGIAGADAYLAAATTLSNTYIWGRLSCSLVVHPSTQKDHGKAVDKAIAALEYGSICINGWSGLAYSYECGAWGAYAGGNPPLERIECIESGLGLVNNCLGFDHIEKCVVTIPFIDKNVQIGTGAPLDRETTLNLTNLLINPGLPALLKLLLPSLFKPRTQCLLGTCFIGVVALAAAVFA